MKLIHQLSPFDCLILCYIRITRLNVPLATTFSFHKKPFMWLILDDPWFYFVMFEVLYIYLRQINKRKWVISEKCTSIIFTAHHIIYLDFWKEERIIKYYKFGLSPPKYKIGVSICKSPRYAIISIFKCSYFSVQWLC